MIRETSFPEEVVLDDRDELTALLYLSGRVHASVLLAACEGRPRRSVKRLVAARG